jgi:DNA-directed RNA polymerase subunit H (RpoH/RPB5)
MSNSNSIQRIYKSRKTILEILEKHQGHDTSDYSEFSINEIDTMFNNSQLDMLVTNESANTKSYVKYFLDSRQIRPQNLDDIIEDLFIVENILTKNDTLVIITEDEPNETILARMKYLYDKDGIFVVIHNISRLQFNLLNHALVPSMRILNSDEQGEMMQKFNMKDISQFPEIGRFDPQALAMSMRPGQVGMFERDSITALKTEYYRVCV